MVDRVKIKSTDQMFIPSAYMDRYRIELGVSGDGGEDIDSNAIGLAKMLAASVEPTTALLSVMDGVASARNKDAKKKETKVGGGYILNKGWWSMWRFMPGAKSTAEVFCSKHVVSMDTLALAVPVSVRMMMDEQAISFRAENPSAWETVKDDFENRRDACIATLRPTFDSEVGRYEFDYATNGERVVGLENLCLGAMRLVDSKEGTAQGDLRGYIDVYLFGIPWNNRVEVNTFCENAADRGRIMGTARDGTYATVGTLLALKFRHQFKRAVVGTAKSLINFPGKVVRWISNRFRGGPPDAPTGGGGTPNGRAVEVTGGPSDAAEYSRLKPSEITIKIPKLDVGQVAWWASAAMLFGVLLKSIAEGASFVTGAVFLVPKPLLDQELNRFNRKPKQA